MLLTLIFISSAYAMLNYPDVRKHYFSPFPLVFEIYLWYTSLFPLTTITVLKNLVCIPSCLLSLIVWNFVKWREREKTHS